MKTLIWLFLPVICVAALGGCAGTTADLAAQSQQLTQAVQNANAATSAAKAALDAVAERPAADAPLAKTSEALGKASDAMTAATQVLGAVTSSLQASATRPANDPITAGIAAAARGAQVAGPLIPQPYGTLVELGGYLASAILGAFTVKSVGQSKTVKAAAQANTDAIQSALAHGQLAVTSPTAAAAVNAAVADHPIGDALVRVIAGAQVGAQVAK